MAVPLTNLRFKTSFLKTKSSNLLILPFKELIFKFPESYLEYLRHSNEYCLLFQNGMTGITGMFKLDIMVKLFV